MGFFKQLFSGNPLGQIDEMIVFGLLGVVFLCAMTYADWQWGSHTFSGMGFAGAFATIMGACGLGAGARNWMNGKADQDHPEEHHDNAQH